MTETVVRQNRIARNADRVGVAAMIVASICLVALGSRWVSGPMVAVVVLVLLLVLGSVLGLAVAGGPEARRLLAPYGLLKPGMLWLALFFLAP
ncbi:MAG: hypothetical protein RLZ02_1811, partial [Actinomycetota bacterium]